MQKYRKEIIIAEISTKMFRAKKGVDTRCSLEYRLFHQLFIGSLDCMVFFLFLYVDVKTREQKRYTIRQIAVRVAPISIAIVAVIFGKLEYHVGTDGRYSYGFMAMTVYSSMFIYIFMTMYKLIKCKEGLGEYERRNILYGIGIWEILALIQLLRPVWLLSSIGVALMLLFVYLSFENPRIYVDYEVAHASNRRAFDVILTEQIEKRKPFIFVNITIINDTLLRNTYGNQEILKVLDELAQYMGSEFRETIYHIDKCSIGMILSKAKFKLVESCLAEIQRTGKEADELTSLLISALECPRYADTKDVVENIREFIESRKTVLAADEILYVNEKIIGTLKKQELIERVVQKALQEDGLEVYYQPIYAAKQNRFLSAEALVRLKDRETVGYISPEVFIPIAERCNMIEELGEIVFDKVCRFYKEERLAEWGVQYIEVNLSGKQIVNKNLPNTLLQCVKKYGISPKVVNLEITETAAVKAESIQIDNMRRLREEGFDFSMDDFGTGYSNLAEMKNGNFDLIKLDKSLIWPCFEENGADACVILDTCIDMIHKLKKHIVAEGVETREQVQYLTEREVSYLQGYYFSKPLDEKSYLAFLFAHEKKADAECI